MSVETLRVRDLIRRLSTIDPDKPVRLTDKNFDEQYVIAVTNGDNAVYIEANRKVEPIFDNEDY